MEKFTIKEKLEVNHSTAYHLNMPFIFKQRDKDFNDMVYRLSSYHEEDSNERNWLRYRSLMRCRIIIACSSENYTIDEALAFTAQHNGFGLTRDNLFSLASLFPESLQPFHRIHAFMPLDLLPNHLNGPKICPVLEIIKNTETFNFDWYWAKDTFTPNQEFAFIIPDHAND